ncbi:hypothetical protein J8F10_37400 [Gemmata sp. G18]|uniref:Phage tail protein n=1 Tax=Gemmata palustris TaxID=2822762 RepID=A0ABS5C4L0_9BACT|nr:hypothetical protein [Gemmata palustris]MBP3954965.1 hypothetical protein [Gemmata palustris]MBP3960932.1 hypothetical protein [Gemmata palustris]
MAVDGYCVNGAARVQVGTGSAGALELLGYTDRGVQIDITELKKDIVTDISGEAPQDVQDMSMTARIVVNLIAMDRAVFKKLQGRGDRTTPGLANTAGLVLGAGGYLFRVGIESPFDEPWSFNKCFIRPGYGTTLASAANPFRIEFQAIPWAAATAVTNKDTPLWTRSLS